MYRNSECLRQAALAGRSPATVPVRAEQVAYRRPSRPGIKCTGLEPVSLIARPGDALLVAGPSGCGKSTLARCLTGLIPHLYRGELSGRVLVGGLDTRETPLWRLSERAGLLFQNPAAQMLTSSVEQEIVFGLENLGLPPAQVTERLEIALARFGLHALRDRVPQSLSGGEQQRLALAAVTARRPALLVLDEPLSMLDSAAAASLTAYLADLCKADDGQANYSRADGRSVKVRQRELGRDRPPAVIVCEHRMEPLRGMPGLRTIHLDRAGQDGSASHTWSETSAWASCFPVSTQPPFRLRVSDLDVQLGGRYILRGFGFSASGGQVLAIVGCNGVGKTTLLRALAGLQKHSGRVVVERPARTGGERRLVRGRLGMVFQNPDLQLFCPTVRQEILYRVPGGVGPDPDMARYSWLIRALGLDDYQETSPLLLSEGEKKRVALATVLMRDHAHGVLLDEPTLGQDHRHRSMLVRLARALADAGQLVVLSTHDLSLAACADRLLLLANSDAGGRARIVADGPPARVLNDSAAWSAAGLLVPDWVSARCSPSIEASAIARGLGQRMAART